MPTKKTIKKAPKKEPISRKVSNLDIQKLIQSSDSYKSLIYGILTVLVLFVVIVLGVRTLSVAPNGEITDNGAATQQDIRSTYTVTEGDTLWSIAEKEYGDGFKWNEIAKANNLSEASTLEEGTRLTIPNVSGEVVAAATIQVSPTITAVPTQVVVKPTEVMVSPAMAPNTIEGVLAPSQNKISGTSYTIVSGDNLWDIAVRAYGDGYRWTEIASANALENPDLIFPGNTLKLPRP